MKNAKTIVPKPLNEPILSYAPGTEERTALKKRIKELKSQIMEEFGKIPKKDQITCTV